MSNQQFCDSCDREANDLLRSHSGCYSGLLLCGACRGVRTVEYTPQYLSAADLAEDCGIFDPAAEGFSYVEGKGWTRG